ncbi:uncharacterized protein LOC106178298 [Lingula anatina]|uniref:Uncharacterized protein LOC106178298 n=1 Tax=Lingula anatina TaxID=7574 RepID=A0A1S3K378_LINAN|nr:uncharacterized protein LOC106178298 [Lingula anatina]|eukprot:XP_013416874.1 uncharacterized protein LOC106178298 [Lingula anatina]
MGSKNLAIVWAPNLLRSKELEQGGGAAALQGVGVQAVVTEFLIKHAETIFGDQSVKKLARPKSLCVATPTKLLSLEEAQQKQKYIEVGGGPAALPEFHTILEHPRKRSRKSGGWKALFKGSGGKTSSGAAKPKYRKSSTPVPSKFSGKQHNTDVSRGDTRRKLRMVKSADSLATMSALPHAGALIANPYAEESPKLERPKSVDDSSITTGTTVVEAPMPRSNSLESYFEMPIDADAQSDVTEDSIVSEQTVSQKPSKKKQRTASEPSTPQELKVFEIELESKKSHRSPSLKQKIAKALSPKARRKRSTPSPSNGKRLVSAPILQTPPSSESSSPLCHKSFSFSDSTSLDEKFQNKNGGGGSGVFYVPNETQEPGEILELAHSPGAKRKSVRRFSEFDSTEDVSQDTSQTLEASQSDGNLSSSTLDLSIENLSTENYNLVEEVQSAIQERGQKDSSPDILGSRSSEPDLLKASKDSSAQSVPNTNDSVSSNTKEDSEQSPAAPSEQRKSLKIELRLGTPDSDKFPNLMLTSSDSLFSANSDLKTPDSDVITLDSSSTINSEIMEQWSRTLGADSTAESCDNLSCHSWNFANNEDRRLSQSSDEYFSTLSRDSEQGTLTRSDWGTLRDSNFDTLSDSGGHIDYSSEVGDQGTLTRNHDGNQAEPQEQTDFLSDSELIPKETLDLITSGASFDHLGGMTTLTADSSEGSSLTATQGSKEGTTSTTTFLETDIDLLDSSNSHGAPSPVASVTSQSPCPLSPDMAVSPVRQESVDDPAVSQSSDLLLEQRPAFTMSLSSDGGLGDSGEYDNALNRRHSSQGSLHSGDYDNVISHRHESLGSLLDQITPDGSSSLASEDLLSQLLPLSDVAETSLPNTEDAPPVEGGSLGELGPAESSAIVEPAPDNTETADGEEQAPVIADTTEGTVGDVIEEQVPPLSNIGAEAPCMTTSNEELEPVSTVMSVSIGDQDNNLSAEVKTLPTEPTVLSPVASEEIDELVDKVPAPSHVVTETDREDVIVVKPRKILVVKPDSVDLDTKPAPAQDVKPDTEMSDENTASGENMSGLPFRDKSSPVDDSTLYSPRGIGLPHREESVVLRRREITAPSFPSPRSQMVTQVDISDTFVQANPAQASPVQANPAQESSVLASPTEESSPPIVNDQPTQHKRLIRPFEYEDDSIFKSYKSTDSGSDSSSLERDNIPAWDYGRSESKKGIQKFDRDRRQDRWKNSSQKKDGDAATKSGRPSSIGDKVALFSQSQDSTNQNVIKHDGTQAGEVRAYVHRQPRLETNVSSDTSSYVKDHFNIEESVDSEDSCFGSFPRRSKRMGQVETSRDLSTPHQYTPTAQDDSMKTPSIDSAVSSSPHRHHSGGSSGSHLSFKSVAPPSESQVVSTPKTIQVQQGRVQGRAKKPPLHDSKDDKSKDDMRRYIEKPVEIIEKQPTSTSKAKEDSVGGPEKVNSDSGAKRTALVQRKSSVRALMSQFETKSGPDSEAVDSGKSQKQELTEEKDKPHSVLLSRQDSTNTSDSSLITMTPGDSDSLGKLYRRGLSHEQGQGRYSGRRYGPSEEPIVRPSMLRKLSAPPVFTGAGHTEYSLPSQTSQSSSPMSPS